jgi:CTP:phosphocholine cytidylyltransferase-like protein
LPSGVGDFPVLHFLPVFDFISHFYQLFLVSCLFDSYVLLADDHVNNELFPLHVNQKEYFCVLREGYYVTIWLIVRICVFIKD